VNEPVQLSLEQQFNLRSFETQVAKMSREQAQQFLVKMYERFMANETMLKLVAKESMINIVDTRKIPLADKPGTFALVDYADAVWLEQWTWYSSVRGYPRRNAIGTADTASTLMQRVILEFYGHDLMGLDVDHINGNPLDNRKCNLRVVSHQENCFNRKLSKNNSTGYKGVSIFRPNGKYKASIKVNYKQIHLGYFETPEDAALAYNNAATKYFGEFARLNEIPKP
jgi:hypothetical protein